MVIRELRRKSRKRPRERWRIYMFLVKGGNRGETLNRVVREELRKHT